MRKMIVSATGHVIPAQAGISFRYALVLFLLSTSCCLLMSACTLYDNYDIDMMNGTADNTERSSGSVDPASSGSESSSSADTKQSSESGKSTWTCGDSSLVRGDYKYKTVLINGKCWTRENMRYVPSTGATMCYDKDEANCQKYGLLYDYPAAEAVCPSGWRLPSSDEFVELQEYSGADNYEAGTHFKATTGWSGESGDDLLEFSGLPGGSCNYKSQCMNIGGRGYWWTSTEKVKNSSHLTMVLSGDNAMFSAEMALENEVNFISVRCIKIE